MKKIHLFFTTLLALSILSCTSDDENKQIVSKFTIMNEEYITPHGYRSIQHGYHSIMLMNSATITNEINEESCIFSNDFKHGAEFIIKSSSKTELPIGTYNTTKEPKLNSNELHYSIDTNILVTNNCITEEPSGGISSSETNSGYLIIEKTEDIYTLTYEFKTSDFGTVKGSYIGALEEIVVN